MYIVLSNCFSSNECFYMSCLPCQSQTFFFLQFNGCLTLKNAYNIKHVCCMIKESTWILDSEYCEKYGRYRSVTSSTTILIFFFGKIVGS